MSEQGELAAVYHIDIALMQRARQKALRNAIDSVNAQIKQAEQDLQKIKTAELALGRVQVTLQRMREISVEAATNPAADFARLNQELDGYKKEIDKTVAEATFDGVNLLDGSMGSINSIIAAANDILNKR